MRAPGPNMDVNRACAIGEEITQSAMVGGPVKGKHKAGGFRKPTFEEIKRRGQIEREIEKKKEKEKKEEKERMEKAMWFTHSEKAKGFIRPGETPEAEAARLIKQAERKNKGWWNNLGTWAFPGDRAKKRGRR